MSAKLRLELASEFAYLAVVGSGRHLALLSLAIEFALKVAEKGMIYSTNWGLPVGRGWR